MSRLWQENPRHIRLILLTMREGHTSSHNGNGDNSIQDTREVYSKEKEEVTEPITLDSVEDILTIHVTDLGKYIILVNMSSGKADQDLARNLEYLRDSLNKWWLSDDKFIVVATGPNAEIRFQRLDDEG